jgi:pimeloyl-ACP methyl ester carboxylesterase
MGSRLYYNGAKKWDPSVSEATLPLNNTTFMTQMKPYLLSDENGTPDYILDYTRQADDYGAKNTYATIYNYLDDAQNFPKTEYNVKFFTYDWRLSNAENANRLANYISGDNKVILIAHSMGGLVASAYLAKGASYRNKVEKLITFGTPYLGAAKTIGTFETGETFGFPSDLVMAPHIQELSINTASTYELLPTYRNENFLAFYDPQNGTTTYYNYLDSMDFLSVRPWARKTNGTVKPMLTDSEAFHDSLMMGDSHIADYFGATYYIYGLGHSTPSTAIYSDFSIGVDFLSYFEIATGDGTVTSQSAKNMSMDFNYYSVSSTHQELVSDPDALAHMKSIIESTTSYGTYSTSTSITDSSRLARGTLIEEESTVDCVSVVIQGAQNLQITDSDGNELMCDGDRIYRVNADGTVAEVGCVWLIDSERLRYQYVLEPGDYQFNDIEFDASIQTEILIMSFDNDLYTSKVRYDDIVGDEISLDISFGGSTLIDKATMEEIIPAKVATPQELQTINASRGVAVS